MNTDQVLRETCTNTPPKEVKRKRRTTDDDHEAGECCSTVKRKLALPDDDDDEATDGMEGVSDNSILQMNSPQIHLSNAVFLDCMNPPHHAHHPPPAAASADDDDARSEDTLVSDDATSQDTFVSGELRRLVDLCEGRGTASKDNENDGGDDNESEDDGSNDTSSNENNNRNENNDSNASNEEEEHQGSDLSKSRRDEAMQFVESLMRPLTEEEQQIVDDAIGGGGPDGEILAKMETDSVQRQSMRRLQPGEWLNDEVIHYFFLLLAKRDEEFCKLDLNRKRSLFFKSFFITKLLNEGHNSHSGRYSYDNVKIWSKNVPGGDIFQLGKIFVPINYEQMHWMCACIDMTKKKIFMYDSMGSSGKKYLESLFQYIQDEHQETKGEPLPDIGEWELVGHQPGTPCQQNGYDCGVFTCMFADFLSKEWPLIFTQEHVTQCRERIALSIMQGIAMM